jgi:hypothetical protein
MGAATRSGIAKRVTEDCGIMKYSGTAAMYACQPNTKKVTLKAPKPKIPAVCILTSARIFVN